MVVYGHRHANFENNPTYIYIYMYIYIYFCNGTVNGIGCETGNVHLKMLYILHKCFLRIYCISTRIRYRRRARELGSILRCVFLFCRLLEIRKSFSPSLFCHRSRYRCVQIMCFYQNVYTII